MVAPPPGSEDWATREPPAHPCGTMASGSGREPEMGAIRQTVLLAAVASGFLLSAMELGTVGTSTVAGAAGSAPVATTTLTFVDTSRPTPPWNGMPEKPT